MWIYIANHCEHASTVLPLYVGADLR